MKEIKDIPTIPFSKHELSQKYELTRFIEAGQPFCVLVPQDPSARINTGNMWKFGVVKSTNPKKIDWFFSGRVQTRSRKEARRIYTLLQVYCQAKNVGEAFAFKVRAKRKK
jgi:hypothetical protein